MIKVNLVEVTFHKPHFKGDSEHYHISDPDSQFDVCQPLCEKYEVMNFISANNMTIVNSKAFFEADQVEKEWESFWETYQKENPGADGCDYTDEREMFMMEKFGGRFKHM